MTHVPFTSRLASLMGISTSNPTSPKYDGADDYYIPYTGTYEPAPGRATIGAAGGAGAGIGATPTPGTGTGTVGSSSTHTQARTRSHAHTLSGSTKNTHTSHSIPPNHPYNPHHHHAATATASSTLATSRVSEEVERGRRATLFPPTAPRLSTSSSFAAMTPSEYHGSAFPRVPSSVNPNPSTRRGGPSYLALDGGFIGQSPAPPRESTGGGVGGRSEGGKSDRGAAYRSSFASFITFGNSRKSIASASGVSSGLSQLHPLGAHDGGSGRRAWPLSATTTSFPHGASKLRGELRPTVADFMDEDDEDEGENGDRRQGSETWTSLPPIPPYMRQRSQSYVDETDQMWRRKSEEERRQRALEEELLRLEEERAMRNKQNAVKVTMPTSFFDVSPAEEYGSSNPFGSGRTRNASVAASAPHPYHRHYQPTIVEPPSAPVPERAVDLASPISPSFDFLHPYATAPTSATTSPTKSAKSRPSNVSIRPLIIPRKSPDSHHREHQHQHQHDGHGRGRSATATAPTFPFTNPFSSAYQASPPTSRPVTPKGRLRSLVSLEGLRAIKGSISTPNLRAAAKGQPTAPVVDVAAEGTQASHHTTRTAPIASTSRGTIPPNAVLQGQTLCDTFFLPRPRFHAHQISPPDTPPKTSTPAPEAGPTPVQTRHRYQERERERADSRHAEVLAAREWNRRATAATVAVTRSDPDAERRLQDAQHQLQQAKALGRKKASAPDLRRKPSRPALKDMRRLTEAEKVLLEGQEREREREAWQRAAKGSFQNERSRSLSRTRTKSFAKGSHSAANSGDERERSREKPSRKNTMVGQSSVAITNPSVPGTAPPTATSSSGPTTSGDEGRPNNQREKEPPRLGVKSSMEYLATRAFSQGYSTIAPAPGSTSTHSHTRHQSGDMIRDRQQRERAAKTPAMTHRRSESWGRTALKMAKNSCADPESISPAIERVFEAGESIPQVQVSKPAHEEIVLDIRPSKVEERPNSEHSSWRPSAIGIAIGTPPVDSILNDPSAGRIEHPYGGTPVFVGPHPTSPTTSLIPPSAMNNVALRHRLPPRAHAAMSPPRSPDAGLAGLDAYVPNIETSAQSVFSRESWLVYMNALDEPEDTPRTVDKGKGRAVEMEPIIYEERPSRDVPEDVDTSMDTPELQLDLGLDGSPSKSARSRIVSTQDMDSQLTKAFRRQSTASSNSSENEHAALTFEAGATLSRLLSSRSVTSTPRSGLKRTISNPETPKIKKSMLTDASEDPQATVTQGTSTRPPLPNFEPKTHHRSSSGGASRRISGYSDVASGSGHDSLWRKSIASSDLAAHSPPSHESSPKASPRRTLVNIDDLDGYSDLFYVGGHGSVGGRPKSGSSGKTNVSSSLAERLRRPELVTFGSKGSGSSNTAERSYSSPESARAAAGRPWSASGLSPPPSRGTARVLSGDAGEKLAELGKVAEEELDRTWDPEEEDEEEGKLKQLPLFHKPYASLVEPYRIGDTRQPIVARPTLPIMRHSTKLSVIEGSIDEHATASESTPDPEDQQSAPATSPTRATIPEAHAHQNTGYPPLTLDTLNIPSNQSRRASSERAVAPEGYARTSLMTDVSGQSRMSHLSDFPAPPVQSTSFALTPSDALQTYFPPRRSSPVPPASPASLLSVEPPSPVVEPDEGEDRSISEHHQAFPSLTSPSTPVREYRSNRATFGPDADIARQWAERERTYTPSTEEH
ncbi:hypothetical protein M408DRAFT_265203 [Serendipita vermifera MAFF 305830]|uniref:Uncharacterized protein n=1 Tax=Serendipita vermifera MAFF 305830 TaxID=933852 RepID=A0A0C3ATB6_SERVB|nr:hypothetical protein M408DRAFT_265203 [Serendipita vermifera MAFF 305830]